MKYFFFSFFMALISYFHFFLNKLIKIRFINADFLYVNYQNRDLFESIKIKLKGSELIHFSIHQKSSFLKRINCKHKVHFNNLISKPFNRIVFSKIKFYSYFEDYMIANYDYFLENSDIKIIFLYDEYSLPSKSLIFSSKKSSIKTIAFQHGVIYDSHWGYKRYKSADPSEVASMMLVYSNNELEILSKVSNIKNIVVVGSPRHDHLKYLSFDKNIFCRKYGLDSSKKIILWTTQSHDKDLISNNENELNCSLLFPFFYQNRDKFNLIIKLHPNEDQKATIYHKWNKRFGKFVTILNYEEDTSKIIKISEVTIIKNSTTGMESILLNKPIIILDLIKNLDYSIYTGSGFDLVIKNKEDLKVVFKKVFTQDYQNLFKERRNKFQSERFPYFGNSTDKVIKIIKDEL